MTEEEKETYYVILNMNIQYEICRMCPKSGLFKGTYKECEAWIKGATEVTKELQEELTEKDKSLKESISENIQLRAELNASKGNYTVLKKQLTEAKEIIKGMKCHLDLSDCVNNDYRLQLLERAEQFLGE